MHRIIRKEKMQDSAMDGFTYAGKLIPKGKHIDVLAHLRIGHPLRLDVLFSALFRDISFMIELHRSIVF